MTEYVDISKIPSHVRRVVDVITKLKGEHAGMVYLLKKYGNVRCSYATYHLDKGVVMFRLTTWNQDYPQRSGIRDAFWNEYRFSEGRNK